MSVSRKGAQRRSSSSHWSSQSFGDFWKDALSVLMARERARIGLAASKGDWPRRIAEYARDDQEDAAAYAANY